MNTPRALCVVDQLYTHACHGTMHVHMDVYVLSLLLRDADSQCAAPQQLISTLHRLQLQCFHAPQTS